MSYHFGVTLRPNALAFGPVGQSAMRVLLSSVAISHPTTSVGTDCRGSPRTLSWSAGGGHGNCTSNHIARHRRYVCTRGFYSDENGADRTRVRGRALLPCCGACCSQFLRAALSRSRAPLLVEFLRRPRKSRPIAQVSRSTCASQTARGLVGQYTVRVPSGEAYPFFFCGEAEKRTFFFAGKRRSVPRTTLHRRPCHAYTSMMGNSRAHKIGHIRRRKSTKLVRSGF
jgi:hypothetical protein